MNPSCQLLEVVAGGNFKNCDYSLTSDQMFVNRAGIGPYVHQDCVYIFVHN